jgi:hypothetical protein
MDARTEARRIAGTLAAAAAIGLVGASCGTSGTTGDGFGGQGTSNGSTPGGGSPTASGSHPGGSSGSTAGNGSGNSGTGGTTSGTTGATGTASGTGSTSSRATSGSAMSGSGTTSGTITTSGTTSSSSTSTVTAMPDDGGTCAITSSNVRVTEIDLGVAYKYQEVDANGGDNIGLALLSISPLPSGGSRIAFMGTGTTGGTDGMVHIAQLDTGDQLVAGSTFTLPAFDFQDIYADDAGGTVLLSRDAMGGGTGNCGAPTNLCGTPPNPPDPCWDMYLVRFDAANATKETWAHKLTTSSATLPPYSTGPTGPEALMIWWYAHNGRIAFNGTNYAAYYGVAISVSQGGCINIHQGDEMRVVSTAGATVTGGFDVGCSHSAFERLLWDGTKFVPVCNNDADPGGTKTGRMAFAPNATTIYAVDEANAELGSVVKAGGGGYWLALSDLRPGQTAGTPGLDDVHLVHTTTGASDMDITLASDTGLNDRAPHLAPFGTNRMLAAWETSTRTDHLAQNDANRKLYVQALNATSGATQGSPFNVAGVKGSRYQDFRTFPDNSVAYIAPGSTATKVKIVRVMPCP